MKLSSAMKYAERGDYVNTIIKLEEAEGLSAIPLSNNLKKGIRTICIGKIVDNAFKTGNYKIEDKGIKIKVEGLTYEDKDNFFNLWKLGKGYKLEPVI